MTSYFCLLLNWKSLKLTYQLTLSQTSPGFTCLKYKSLENTVRKGKIARNKQFLLFSQCFLPVWRTLCHFYQVSNCRLQTLWIWKSLKLVIWERVKGLSDAWRDAWRCVLSKHAKYMYNLMSVQPYILVGLKLCCLTSSKEQKLNCNSYLLHLSQYKISILQRWFSSADSYLLFCMQNAFNKIKSKILTVM